MPELHPQFLTDPDGKPRSVLLPFDEYAALMDYLEDIEDLRAAEDALRKIESGEDSVISLDEFLRSDLAR
jgi:predicted DNA-binding protein